MGKSVTLPQRPSPTVPPSQASAIVGSGTRSASSKIATLAPGQCVLFANTSNSAPANRNAARGRRLYHPCRRRAVFRTSCRSPSQQRCSPRWSARCSSPSPARCSSPSTSATGPGSATVRKIAQIQGTRRRIGVKQRGKHLDRRQAGVGANDRSGGNALVKYEGAMGRGGPL